MCAMDTGSPGDEVSGGAGVWGISTATTASSATIIMFVGSALRRAGLLRDPHLVVGDRPLHFVARRLLGACTFGAAHRTQRAAPQIFRGEIFDGDCQQLSLVECGVRLTEWVVDDGERLSANLV